MSALYRPAMAAMILAGLTFGLSSSVRAADLFPDKALGAVVRDGLKKGEKDELKEEDLKNLYFLMGKGKKITNLSGLEKCLNLASIDLAKNDIQDLKPLAGLKNVQTLDLTENKIADLAPLAGLEKLQYLKLDKNQIEKLDAIKGLKKLSALYLSNNKIKSVEALSGLEKLSSLYLDHNEIADIGSLRGLKWLSSLDVQHNAITDLAALEHLNELRYTLLQDNKIADLTILVTMAQRDVAGEKRFAPYWHVYLKGNPLSDAAKGKQLEDLKKLGVRVNLEK